MLNTLILLRQARNEEAVPMLRDQKELLLRLLGEKKKAEKDYQRIAALDAKAFPDKSISFGHQEFDPGCDRATDKPNPKAGAHVQAQSGLPKSSDRNRVSNSIPHESSQPTLTFETLVEEHQDTSRSIRLPFLNAHSVGENIVHKDDKAIFELYEDQLLSQLELARKLLAEIANPDYSLSHRFRADMEAFVIYTYWTYQEQHMPLSNQYLANEFKESLRNHENGDGLVSPQ